MHVRTFFLLCMMAGAAAGIGFAGQGVLEAWTAADTAGAARRELLAFRDVLRIPEMVAAERVTSVGQLSAPGVASGQDRETLDKVRRTTDGAFNTAIASLSSTHDATSRSDQVAAAKSLMTGVRREIDRLTGLPRTERPESLAVALQPTQRIYLDINRLLTRLQSDATLQNASIQDDLDLSRLAYSLRQWAAQRGTALIGAIASGKPMPPAVIEDLANSVGHIEELWDQVKTYQETRQLAPEILAGIAAVQARYFGDNGALYDKVLVASRTQGPYPSLADFRRDHAPGVMAPFLIRDGALTHAIGKAETLADAARSRLVQSILLLLTVCSIIVGATWLFSRMVVGALTTLTATITTLAARDHAIEVPFQTRRNEIGRMAQAIERLRQDGIAFTALSEQTAQAQAARQTRAERVDQLCVAFQDETRTTIEAAIESAAAMRDGAETSSTLVHEVGKRTVTVAAATSQATTGVAAIASSTAHLTRSIDGLSDQVAASTRIASQAEHAVGQAGARMHELTAATTKIGAVTALIRQIASQTNLLALNATIEAARAGEAGKGFAVVASEVKALADQTARATQDIATQIDLVQAATQGVGAMIGEVTETVTEINRVGQHVAETVEQQKHATNAIECHVSETEIGIRAVAADINDVQGVTVRTGTAATQVVQGVTRLTGDAERLMHQITAFLGQVRETSPS